MSAVDPTCDRPIAVGYVASLSNGDYRQAPNWHRSFLYGAGLERGLDAVEDLASPGEFSWHVWASGDQAIWQLRATAEPAREELSGAAVVDLHRAICTTEMKRRSGFATPLDRAADAYLVRRGARRTIIAGYPWFTDWAAHLQRHARLCLATRPIQRRQGHSGRMWPWLIKPFVEVWVRVRGNTSAVRRDARSRFIAPLLSHLQTAGLGHISEIADAEAPFEPKGCPFQAWSLGELVRLDRMVLADANQLLRMPHEARQAV